LRRISQVWSFVSLHRTMLLSVSSLGFKEIGCKSV
jgi:hypothetical protein